MTTLTTDANLTATIAVSIRAAQGGSEPCDVGTPLGNQVITGVAMTLNGPLQSSPASGGQVTMTFANTMANLTINGYSADCVPDDYLLVLDGSAQVSQLSGGPFGSGSGEVGYDVAFDDFTIDAEVSGTTTTADFSGKITAICFGGTAMLSTPTSVSLILGEFCPTGGTIAVQDVGEILYSNGPGDRVTVDDGTPPDETYPTCLDPALLACIG
jgi:hypothetical protein